ncbi:MAG: hypothetical protein QOF76_184 [Solirubrobacteraceae bacterium]|nr:hypothetical protein [Solirubrobacteraceae bacterium]
MVGWSLVRFLHLAAMAFFVGGQLMLLLAVGPAIRAHGTQEAMRMAARRFGVGSAAALGVLIATGCAMASHYGRWSDSTLHAKLAVVVGVLALLGVHVAKPQTRGIGWALAAASLVIVWLGIRVAHG